MFRQLNDRAAIICLLVVVLAASVIGIPQATAQTAGRTLSVSESVADSLGEDDMHRYSVSLDAGQFVFGTANQESVDVVIEVIAPDSSTVVQIDMSGEGPEPFNFESEAKGVYELVVTPFEKDTGRYTLRLDGIEPIAETPEARVEQLAYRLTGDAPGLLVGVVRNGELTYSGAFGMADLTAEAPFTVDTPSNIGSVSKQFTAMAVLLLEHEGKLSLDDPVTKHLPEVKAFEDTVRIRHLLTHTSGYREIMNTAVMSGIRIEKGDFIDDDMTYEVIQRQPELQNSPGARWNYNNTGYQLLARIVAKVSGMSFPTYMNENVFQPLGMTNTLVRAPRSEIVPHAAQGYVMEDGEYREGFDLPASMGAGGMYTTLGDLAKWIDNFDTHELGGSEAYEKMTTPYVLASGDTTEYGLGLFVQKRHGLNVIQHGGSDLAHRAQLTYFPDLDAGFILMSNNAMVPGSLPQDVAEVFFGDAMELESDTAPADEATSDSSTFDPAEMTPQRFETFAGRYELDNVSGFVLTFTQEEGTFYVQATGQPKLEIVPVGPKEFDLIAVEARVEFRDVADGKAQALTLYQNGEQPASRIEAKPWEPAADSLAAYAGNYYSDELQTTYTMVVEDGVLVLTHARLDDIELRPTKEDRFSGTFPVTNIEFVRGDNGSIVGFDAGNGRTEGVHFERME
ncbi:hypothetical protein CRI94_03170 [Longibacter salinarum]|uniref:Beta-lactamase-related domain-containing protein n=1 Tax=Longibacter salinarum TaxID=1850348 RepID=A0A2A8D2X2_9BACT|nr:serine hydrolase domain-containing protein [Longibacter salinarum]PEN15295.1 hypothetical protein CRI94_03170 [Longibacter salinarum]